MLELGAESVERTIARRRYVALIFGAFIAGICLVLYGQHRIDAENFGLGPETTRTSETLDDGRKYTAGFLDEIIDVMHDFSTSSGSRSSGREQKILWLGNSQLHAINQFKKGQHVAPYWFLSDFGCSRCLVPLGISVGNANLQEHYVLSRYVAGATPIDGVVLELCFDDLREDGLRPEFSKILSKDVRRAISEKFIGAEILAAWEKTGTAAKGLDESAGLDGFVQKHLEDGVSAALGKVLPLWNERPGLRARLMVDLYIVRNAVFGIKTTSVRKMIRPRYEKNMRALTEIFSNFRGRGIPVLAYIAPIRQDHALPYDLAEYEAWKVEVGALARLYDVRFLNLEELVPERFWGTVPANDDVDFMHFQEEGHKLLARALVPHVRAMLEKRR